MMEVSFLKGDERKKTRGRWGDGKMMGSNGSNGLYGEAVAKGLRGGKTIGWRSILMVERRWKLWEDGKRVNGSNFGVLRVKFGYLWI